MITMLFVFNNVSPYSPIGFLDYLINTNSQLRPTIFNLSGDFVGKLC